MAPCTKRGSQLLVSENVLLGSRYAVKNKQEADRDEEVAERDLGGTETSTSRRVAVVCSLSRQEVL